MATTREHILSKILLPLARPTNMGRGPKWARGPKVGNPALDNSDFVLACNYDFFN